MIKAIVFDYGGVITSGGGGNEVAGRLAYALSVPIEEADVLLRAHWGEFVMGKITLGQFWQKVEAVYGKPVPQSKRHIWNTWADMAPRSEMITFVDELKARGYTVGLLSNVIPVTEAIIREQGIYTLFVPCILSSVYGHAKPDAEVYQELLRQLDGVKPHEIVFVDDQERCLAPARALGIHTVLAQSSEQIIREVRAILATDE